jgi:lipopolysaccharide export system protein LptA
MIMTTSRFPRQGIVACFFAAGFTLSPLLTHAEQADRDKPVNLEADRVFVDEARKVQVFEGNVRLSKGSLVIVADKLVVSQDDGGYQRGVATGSIVLPRFSQKREGSDETIEGEAERIEHDARGEKTEFFGQAWVKSGLDEVRGQYISFDAKTEKYLVTSGPNGTSAKPGSGSRVRAVIQAKPKGGAAVGASKPTSTQLRTDQSLSLPGREAAP